MRRIQSRVQAAGARRGGFTLIEVLMVMGIIITLTVLLVGVASRVLAKGPQVLTASEIRQFDVAILAFKSDHNNVDYIPSTIVLREDPTTYVMSNALEAASYNWLKKAFGKRLGQGLNPPPASGTNTWLDWNGNGVFDSTPFTLTGDQCLVFFLGGIPTSSGGAFGTKGFSTDPTNPTNFSSGVNINRPYFDFHPSRLVQLPLQPQSPPRSPRDYVPNPTTANGFLSYLDPYGLTPVTGSTSYKPQQRPYVYFSSYKSGNDYNTFNTSDCNSTFADPTVASADPNYQKSVVPYKDPSGRYINPYGYQIISAGADAKFGTGTPPNSGTWNGATGYVPGQAGGTASKGNDGIDDQSNFSANILGAPQK